MTEAGDVLGGDFDARVKAAVDSRLQVAAAEKLQRERSFVAYIVKEVSFLEQGIQNQVGLSIPLHLEDESVKMMAADLVTRGYFVQIKRGVDYDFHYRCKADFLVIHRKGSRDAGFEDVAAPSGVCLLL